jgi:DNA-binding NarL/FixJ family response regulator
VDKRAVRNAPGIAALPLLGIIEPQRIFAPYLAHALAEAGFTVATVLETLSLAEIARSNLAALFVDVDYLDVEPILAIRQLRSVAPLITLCVYTGRSDEEWARACDAAGADCVIGKTAGIDAIVAAIERSMRAGR